MESSKQQPAYISTLTLLNRQLADWQNLLTDFEDQQAPIDQIRYCERQVERLKAELKVMNN
ncbi:hypothetical protein [Spirosoma foliorum]|uniref:Uncharacterized protein n=1 Tax=Spirosoma foliorum TaxID=2710596 RepID=A0A7G5GUG2_9BACT|nr:hypothetical protein [Spirosoma foliorum]QMW02504.1 hypothetical protein H3H32_32120 [Spirosoma foliorum]